MNLNTLNKKYFPTILMVVFMCLSNYLIAQDIAKDKIEILLGRINMRIMLTCIKLN